MAQKELVPAMKPCRTFSAAAAAVNGAASAASCSGEAYETAQEVVGRKSEDQKVVDRLCLRELALDYRAVLQASYWPVPNLVAVVAAGRTGSYWDHLQYKTKLVNIGDPHKSVCGTQTWWISRIGCRGTHVRRHRSVWTRACRRHWTLVRVTVVGWHSSSCSRLLLLLRRRRRRLLLRSVGSRPIRTGASWSHRWTRMLHVHGIGQVLRLLRLAAWLLLLLRMMHRLLLLLRLLVRGTAHLVGRHTNVRRRRHRLLIRSYNNDENN